MERKLAAILAADVVGYSRLMEADEEATVSTLSNYREIICTLNNFHQNTIEGLFKFPANLCLSKHLYEKSIPLLFAIVKPLLFLSYIKIQYQANPA